MLKVRQVADRLSLSESAVRNLIDKGDLSHHRLGGAIRVSEEDLKDYLNEARRERGAISTTRKYPRPRKVKLRHIKL